MSKYRIILDGRTYEMEVEFVPESETALPLNKSEKKTEETIISKPSVNRGISACQKQAVLDNGTVAAPMPGTVIRIMKNTGETVKTGEIVLILEAMKMENEIVAPVDGSVISMNCAEGMTVASGDILFEVK